MIPSVLRPFSLPYQTRNLMQLFDCMQNTFSFLHTSLQISNRPLLSLFSICLKNVPYSVPCLQINIHSVTKTTSETIHHTLRIFLRLYQRQPLFHPAIVKRLHDARFVCVEETGNNYLNPRKS